VEKQNMTWTVNTIKKHMREQGSHWFDPSSMRFFGTKVLPTVYQGPGGIFFVTSEQPPHGKRACTVRQFDPEDGIHTIGEAASMSRHMAQRKARNLAAGSLIGHTAYAPANEGGPPVEAGGFSETSEKFSPVTVLEQFAADLEKHGTPYEGFDATEVARQLMRLARKHHRYMELLCSEEWFCKQVDADGNHPRVTQVRGHIRAMARACKSVIFGGDPRGCTVKLVFADGFKNDMANEGYCVPTEE
jgi:hypothetical protein